MPIITISRGSYSHGKVIAEKVAQQLGYECIAREVLLEASKEFNIPELKLISAVEDAPSILDRFVYGKEKYLAYALAALLKYFKKDNIVYHGFAGHFHVKDISHVINVRIIADQEDRVKMITERDGISIKEARRFIRKLDDQRTKWSKHMLGIDTRDPDLYDLVLRIRNITVDDAAAIISNTASLGHFQATEESQQAMNDIYLASEVKAALIEMKPNIDVSASEGVIYIRTGELESKEIELVESVKERVGSIPGVKDIKIQMLPFTPYGNELM